MKNYNFSVRWFEHDIENLLAGKGLIKDFQGKPIQMIQIGVFEGMATAWYLENILTDPASRLIDIDPFASDSDLAMVNFKDIKVHYDYNVTEMPNVEKLTTLVQKSGEALRTLPLYNFDIIYIDGSHLQKNVLEDAVLSHRLLKAGGIMIFDDYTWATEPGIEPWQRPKEAVDFFLDAFKDHYEIVNKDYQVIVKKIKD